MKFVKGIFINKIYLLLLILLLSGIAYWRYQVSINASENVKSAKVEKGSVKEELVLTGEIMALESANLNFLTSGELNYVGVKEGDYVTKNQILAKLDSTNAYQTYLQAEADLRRYQASLNNAYDQLQGHTNDESFTQIESRTVAETNKDKAYRNFVIAQKNLSNLVLRAPFSGVIASITHPYTGINTALTESQITLVNPDSIYFEVNADQTEVTDLREGQKVMLILDSFPEKEMEGVIDYIGYTPKAGEVGTVYKVKITILDNLDSKVRIGMSGDAKFVISEKDNVLFVPPNFVNTDTTGKYLNLENKNNKKYVEVGIEGEDRVEIIGEIEEGELVFD